MRKWINNSKFGLFIIDLSNLFGIIIDELVKDDDCLNNQNNSVEHKGLIDFIVKAKKQTYAAKQNKIEPRRIDSHYYTYQEGNYQYIDSFFGNSLFNGQELVYDND